MPIYLELSGDQSTYELADDTTKEAVIAQLAAAMRGHTASEFELIDGSTLVMNGSATSHARVLEGKVPSRTMNRH